jgi:hypothetical protein
MQELKSRWSSELFFFSVKCFAPLPKTVRGRAVVISKDPKNENLLYTNGYCVVIRDAEVRLSGTSALEL